MNDPLIMLLSCLVVFHAVSRLHNHPSMITSDWRVKWISLSVLLEIAGAAAAFGESATDASHLLSVPLLLAAIAIAPLAERRATLRNNLHQGLKS